jgi:uncharacterized protein (TIGR02284 family)
MMQGEKLVELLSELIQLDIDAIEAYREAVEGVEDDIMRKRLESFAQHHLNHIDMLSQEVESAGGQPPELSKDLKGLLIKGFAALRSTTGTRGALKALQTAEELTVKGYGNAVSQDVPGVVKALLRKFFSEERNHLDYIRKNLEALR